MMETTLRCQARQTETMTIFVEMRARRHAGVSRLSTDRDGRRQGVIGCQNTPSAEV